MTTHHTPASVEQSVIDKIIRDVCEIEDLPAEDDPDRLEVTVSELRIILESRLRLAGRYRGLSRNCVKCGSLPRDDGSGLCLSGHPLPALTTQPPPVSDVRSALEKLLAALSPLTVMGNPIASLDSTLALRITEAVQALAAPGEGYAVVPIKPTEEMRHAGIDALEGAECGHNDGMIPNEVWHAMLAAAPRTLATTASQAEEG